MNKSFLVRVLLLLLSQKRREGKTSGFKYTSTSLTLHPPSASHPPTTTGMDLPCKLCHDFHPHHYSLRRLLHENALLTLRVA